MRRVARVVVPDRLHCGGRHASQLLDMAAWVMLVPDSDTAGWRESLMIATDNETLGWLRAWSSRGRPLRTDRFVVRLEHVLGRRLRPLRQRAQIT